MKNPLAVLTALALMLGAPTLAQATGPVNVTPPSITGTTTVGSTLTIEHGEWTPTPAYYTYSWERCTGETCAYLEPNVNTVTYSPTSTDVGHTMRALVAAWNSLNQFNWLRTSQTATVTSASTMKVGVDIGGWENTSAIEDAAGAVKVVRASTNHWNTDAKMALLAVNHVQLTALIGNCSSCTIASMDNETFITEYISWCSKYCAKVGSYWTGKEDLGAPTVEVINEPGNPFFHSDAQTTTGEKAYADLTKKMRTRLETAYGANRPKVQVSYDGGYNGDPYGEAIFTDGAVADEVTVHPYGGHIERAKSAEGNRKRVTDAHEKTGLPVAVTEVGWPTCGETGDSLSWTEAEQAANITSFGAWARGLGYVTYDVNFNFADYTGNCYGIVNASDTAHKLAYAALHEV